MKGKANGRQEGRERRACRGGAARRTSESERLVAAFRPGHSLAGCLDAHVAFLAVLSRKALDLVFFFFLRDLASDERESEGSKKTQLPHFC